MEMGQTCPRYTEFRALYPASAGLQQALSEYFAVVVKICQKAFLATKRSTIAQIPKSVLRPFKAEFGPFQKDLIRVEGLVRTEVSLASKKAQNEEATLQASYRAGSIKFRSKTSSELDAAWQARKMRARERQLDALSTYIYETSYKQARKKGTSTWILAQKEVNDWISDPSSSVLCCTGIIGCGKTVSAATLIEHILVSGPRTRVISYFFCRYDDAESLKVRTIIGSIARQLDIEPDVEGSITANIRNLALIDSDKIYELLSTRLSTSRQHFVFIDGLHECSMTEAREVHQILEKLVASPNSIFKVFYTTRPDTYRELLSNSRRLRLANIPQHEENTDIEAFIHTALESALETGGLQLGDPSLIIEIEDTLCRGAQGMFVGRPLQYLMTGTTDPLCASYHFSRSDAESEMGAVCVTYLGFRELEGHVLRIENPGADAAEYPVAILKNTLGESKIQTALKLLNQRKSKGVGSFVSRVLKETTATTANSILSNHQEQYALLNYCKIHWLLHSRHLNSENCKIWSLWATLVRKFLSGEFCLQNNMHGVDIRDKVLDTVSQGEQQDVIRTISTHYPMKNYDLPTVRAVRLDAFIASNPLLIEKLSESDPLSEAEQGHIARSSVISGQFLALRQNAIDSGQNAWLEDLLFTDSTRLLKSIQENLPYLKEQMIRKAADHSVVNLMCLAIIFNRTTIVETLLETWPKYVALDHFAVLGNLWFHLAVDFQYIDGIVLISKTINLRLSERAREAWKLYLDYMEPLSYLALQGPFLPQVMIQMLEKNNYYRADSSVRLTKSTVFLRLFRDTCSDGNMRSTTLARTLQSKPKLLELFLTQVEKVLKEIHGDYLPASSGSWQHYFLDIIRSPALKNSPSYRVLTRDEESLESDLETEARRRRERNLR